MKLAPLDENERPTPTEPVVAQPLDVIVDRRWRHETNDKTKARNGRTADDALTWLLIVFIPHLNRSQFDG